MKEFWTDLKSFVTISMVLLLATVVVLNLFGYKLEENILLLFTNLITSVFTYYFAKKDSEAKQSEEAPVEEKDM